MVGRRPRAPLVKAAAEVNAPGPPCKTAGGLEACAPGAAGTEPARLVTAGFFPWRGPGPGPVKGGGTCFECAAALLAGSILATPALAGVLVVTGDTTGKPTWNRPLGGFPPTPPASSVGTAVPYEVTEFTVTQDGVYSFINDAITPGYDNYLHLYRDSFDPTDQFTNILAGNDDFPTIGRSGFDPRLLTGVTYFAITSGFNNDDFGAWEMTIRGPGDILLGGAGVIPEPGTRALSMAGLGLAGAWPRAGMGRASVAAISRLSPGCAGIVSGGRDTGGDRRRTAPARRTGRRAAGGPTDRLPEPNPIAQLARVALRPAQSRLATSQRGASLLQ